MTRVAMLGALALGLGALASPAGAQTRHEATGRAEPTADPALPVSGPGAGSG